MKSKVDVYITKSKRWQQELKKLRRIVLGCGLIEELKWGQPCYTFKNSNVIILGELKLCCVLSFFKGALLKDSKGILQKPGKNTQSARIIPFTSIQEIAGLEPTLIEYIHEAIDVEKAGLKVNFRKKEEPFPTEFQHALDKNPSLNSAFHALTPGRQRGYILYFSAAKQAKTRKARVEKFTKHILDGRGLND
jgi:uncharacterized protein YdeI (YjbR/CyaY-like superfamily)